MFDSKDFDVLKSLQYCDNFDCNYYSRIGAGNIRTHSRQKGQVYCSICKNRWVITKGTFLFGLKTPIKKVVETLLLMAKGAGLRKTCREKGITPDTIKLWIEKAVNSEAEFLNYMNNKMDLKQNQINDFWAFIDNKKNLHK